MTEREASAIHEAEDTVLTFLSSEAEKAITRIFKYINHTKGMCYCPNCIKSAVNDANSTLNLLFGDTLEGQSHYANFHWEVKSSREGLEIIQGATILRNSPVKVYSKK